MRLALAFALGLAVAWVIDFLILEYRPEWAGFRRHVPARESWTIPDEYDQVSWA